MVGLLIITHDHVGTALYDAAVQMLGMCPLMAEVLPVMADCDPDAMVSHGRELVDKLNQGDGVLILTDMYGSTPSNIAARLAVNHQVLVVSGINLPMLVRIMNYPTLGVMELALKAESGGRDGIFYCVPEILSEDRDT
jgi:PTS system ascorbate-specific IIA component